VVCPGWHQVFEALEEKELDGRPRVRMARGWVSLTSAKGSPLCVAESAVQGLLASVPLLVTLRAAERDAIAARLEAVEVDDAAVVSQGEEGDSMYFVEEGKCAAYINRQRVASYSRGDFFGEMALLTRGPRAATVRAIGRARCLKLSYDAFGPPRRAYVSDQCSQRPVLSHRAFAYWKRETGASARQPFAFTSVAAS
jgi:hypothetical protein